MTRQFAAATRWAGRITSLGAVGFLAAIVIGHGGLPNLRNAPAAVVVQFVSLAVIVAGFVLGWRWEVAGGLAVVAGSLLFHGAEWMANGKPAGGLVPLLVVPGVLYLLSAWLRARQAVVTEDDADTS